MSNNSRKKGSNNNSQTIDRGEALGDTLLSRKLSLRPSARKPDGMREVRFRPNSSGSGAV